MSHQSSQSSYFSRNNGPESIAGTSLTFNDTDNYHSKLVQIMAKPFSTKNAVQFLYYLCDGEICVFENLKYFRNLDMVNFSFTNSQSPITVWYDYMDYILPLFEIVSNDPKYLTYYDPSKGTIHQRLQRGWTNFLTTNRGAHATNGNNCSFSSKFIFPGCIISTIKMPLVLTNKMVHSLNGNIETRLNEDQLQVLSAVDYTQSTRKGRILQKITILTEVPSDHWIIFLARVPLGKFTELELLDKFFRWYYENSGTNSYEALIRWKFYVSALEMVDDHITDMIPAMELYLREEEKPQTTYLEWAWNAISNRLMHALNGNINCVFYESWPYDRVGIRLFFLEHVHQYVQIPLVAKQTMIAEAFAKGSWRDFWSYYINFVHKSKRVLETQGFKDMLLQSFGNSMTSSEMDNLLDQLEIDHHYFYTDRLMSVLDHICGARRLQTRAQSNCRFVPTKPQVNFPLSFSVDSDLTVAMESLTDILGEGITVNHTLDSNSVAQFSSSMKDITEQLSAPNVSVNVKADTASLLQVGSLVALLATGINLYSKRTTTNGVLFGISAVFAMSQHGPFLLDYQKFFQSETTPQFSTGEVRSLVTTVVTLLCGYTCVKSPSDSLISSLTKVLSGYGRQLDSMETIVKWVITAIETCVNLIRRYVLGTSSIKILETERQDLNDLLDRVRELDDQIHLNTFMYTNDNSNRVHSLYKDCVALLAKIPRDKDSSGLIASLNHAISYVFKLKTKMDNMNLNLDGIRSEPCSVLMRGPPGMGKSQAMEHLCMRMLPHLLPPEKVEQALKTPGHFIYNRQAENVYWEGYDYEKVITQFDDLAQAKDVQGNPDNEIMNVIRAINIFQYNLHMAGLENKGNTKFYSKMVIANTNLNTFEFNSIISPDALFRRFDFIVDVLPRAEYCIENTVALDLWKRELDFSKLPKGCLGVTSMHPDMLEFHLFDYKTKQHQGTVYSFDELTDALIARHKLKQQWFAQYQLELRGTKPQVDWASLMPKITSYKFDSSSLDHNVKEFLELFIQNPDYLHCAGMLASCYRRRTGFDHKLEYIVAVYLLANPKFANAHSWSLVDFGTFLLEEGEDINDIPVFGIKYLSIYEKLGTAVQDFKNTHIRKFEKDYPKIAVLSKVLVPIGTIFSIWCVYNHFSTTLEKGSSEYKAKERNPTRTYKKPPSMAHAKALATQPQSLLSHDKSNSEIVNKIVSRNVYELILPNCEERCGFATFIKGNVFMVNRHFISLCIAHIEDSPEFVHETFTLRKPSTNIEFKMPMSVICDFKVTNVLDDQDVGFLLAPSYVPQHTDIVKYFVPREEIHKYKDLIFRLVIPAHNDYRSWTGQARKVDSVSVTDTTVPYVLRLGYKYLATTSEGDCGALMTLSNVHSGAHKLLGIHCAGNPSGFAFSTAVFLEDLTEVLEMFDKQIEVHFEDETSPQCSLPIKSAMFNPLYKHPLRAKRGSGSSIIKSALHGKLGPVKTGISRTSPYTVDGERVDPLEVTLRKYGTNQVYVDPDIIEAVCSQLYDDLNTTEVFRREKRVLTFEEAVIGIENDPVFKSISRQTSPGFPLGHMTKGGGKAHWFGKGMDFDLDNENCQALKSECLRVIEDAKKGIRHEHICADNPKDETLPKEKIAVGKLRAFSASPLVLFIVTRMLFGDFVAWYTSNKVENGSAVGVNCYSSDWTQAALKMLQFGNDNNIGDGDYAGYDTKQASMILHGLNDYIIRRWYGYDDEHDLARRVLFLEVPNSKHIYEDIVYEWFSSLPSGHPLTTIINNLYNHFCFRYCWLAAHDYDFSSLPLFQKCVYLLVLGDDNAFSVALEKLDTFNLKVVEKHMAELGMVYTSADKSSEVGAMKNLEQISFLKRSFRFCPVTARWVAPLQIDSIMEMLVWTKKQEPTTITESNVEIAFRELSLHPREIFDTLTSKILKACEETYVKFPDTTSYRLNLLTVCKKDSYF